MKQVFLTVFSLIGLVLCTQGQDVAERILSYNLTLKAFEVGDVALKEISKLPGPLKIISAIGDARLGKSTNLNFVRHFMQNRDELAPVKQVFNTSDSMMSVTKGIWMSIVHNPGDEGSAVLLDVQGTNLEQNNITDQFSIAAMLLSSGVMLFAEETVKNQNRAFLYQVSRLAGKIWPGKSSHATETFPHLKVVLRGPLEPPREKSLAEHTLGSLTGNETDEGQVIARYFPRRKLSVSTIPYAPNIKLLGNSVEFEASDYGQVIKRLTQELNAVPFKMTAHEGPMDGISFEELVRELAAALNQDSVGSYTWYKAFEEGLCDRIYRKTVHPLIFKESLDEIIGSKIFVLEDFSRRCTIQSKIDDAQRKVDYVIDQKTKKRKQLEKEKELAEKERLRKEADIQRQQRQKKMAEELKAATEREQVAAGKAARKRRELEDEVRLHSGCRRKSKHHHHHHHGRGHHQHHHHHHHHHGRGHHGHHHHQHHHHHVHRRKRR